MKYVNSFDIREVQKVGSCEHANQPSLRIKGGQFPDQLVTISFSCRTSLHGIG
jgi:hypothetical protein